MNFPFYLDASFLNLSGIKPKNMTNKTASAGNSGPKVRSDCYVEVRPGGTSLTIDLNSKVERLYGNQMRRLVTDVAHQLEFENGELRVEDSGALDFVLAARVEAAIKQLHQTS